MNDLEARLAAYADGELGAAEVAEVEQILATDPRARRQVEIHRDVTALLRAACAEPLYAGAAAPHVSQRQPRRRMAMLAAAAAVGALILGFAAGARWTPASGFLDDVAEYHTVYQHETTHLAEVPAEQDREIARWLGGLLRRDVVAPDLTAQGLRFAGARMLVSDGQPVADLLYTRARGLPIALCIVRNDDARSSGIGKMQMAYRGALSIATWQRGAYTFAVVGEQSADEARHVAEQAERQLGL